MLPESRRRVLAKDSWARRWAAGWSLGSSVEGWSVGLVDGLGISVGGVEGGAGLTGEGEVYSAQEVSVGCEDGYAVCGDFGGGEGFRGHELAEEVHGGHRTCSMGMQAIVKYM